MSKTSRNVTKVMASVLSLAMVVTSLTVTGTVSEAKAKIKSVKVTSPVTNGGKLVLKTGQKKRIKVKVTKSGKISTKVTYKSSNNKVAKIVKSKGKVYVKAVGKKNKTAKITIASKANKKKKATLKIKIGTPIKKVSVSKWKITTSVTNNKEADASKRTKKTNKTVKFVSTKKTKMVLSEKYDDEVADTSNSQLATISVKYSPTKVGYKGMKWKVKNSKIAYVSPYGVVAPAKPGTTKIYGYTKDGTNKKVTINLTVKAKPVLATPTPNYEPEDTRTKTVVENFEDYPVGYNWEDEAQEGTSGKATRGKEYVGKNIGKMTVVQDPENPNNKCLKVEYNGDTQAYDYAPIFNLSLKKSLDEYSGVMIQSRVVANNTGDCQHKTVAAYFSKYKTITPEHYFDTSLTKDDAKKKGVDEDLVKFSVDASHATGKDETYNVKGGEFDNMTYNNKSFPMFYNDWSKEGGKIAKNRSVGFKESETDSYKAGWHQNKLGFNKGNITEDGVLNNRKVSMVIGSTYSGAYNNASLTLYLDDLTLLEGETPCTGVKLSTTPTKIAKGMKMSIAKEDIVYEPESTTQTQLTWTSSDEKVVTIDGTKSSPVMEAIGVGKATIKAVVTKNPSISMSFDIEVFEPKLATSDLPIDLSKVKILPKKAEGDTATKVFSSFEDYEQSAAGLNIKFTQANNDHIVMDLGQAYDMTQYKGFNIVGEASDQMSLEMYSENVDFNQDDWWIKQVEYAAYPFFGGSHSQRSFEGTSYGERGVEENLWANWVASEKAPSTAVPGGDMTNVRYIVFKANKYDTALREHKWLIKSLTFKKDEYVNNNPTDAEIEANGGKWFEKK